MQTFELKGAVSPLTVLKLRTRDVEAIERELFDRVDEAPGILLNAPVVVDVGAIGEEAKEIPFESLVAALRRCQVVPIGIANLPAELQAGAAAAGLGVIPLGAARRERTAPPPPAPEPRAPEPEPAPAPAPSPPAPAPTLTVRQPVRGGQVVYAQRADLIVLAPVNPGAQVIADGNIHVYGPLRGRALAGASGDAGARIFCQSLMAELVSVAGEYLSADEIPEVLRGAPAQVFLYGGKCRVSAL